jgi:hypothetical protein
MCCAAAKATADALCKDWSDGKALVEAVAGAIAVAEAEAKAVALVRFSTQLGRIFVYTSC